MRFEDGDIDGRFQVDSLTWRSLFFPLFPWCVGRECVCVPYT